MDKKERRTMTHGQAIVLAAATLVLAGCQPVVAVGWPEMLILVALTTLVVAPLLLRIYRFWLRTQERQGRDGEEKRSR